MDQADLAVSLVEVADLVIVAEWLLCLSDECWFLLHAHRGKEMVYNNGFTTAMSRGGVGQGGETSGLNLGFQDLQVKNLVDTINFLTCQVFSGGRHVFIGAKRATISRR